jgi:hypothetical protein
MAIDRPDDLDDIAALGLTLAQGKQLVALVQQEIVTAQSRDHAVRRPLCRSCKAACQVKDYRPHQIATLFGQVTLRLPRFRCAGCSEAEAGHGCRRIVARRPNSIRSGVLGNVGRVGQEGPQKAVTSSPTSRMPSRTISSAAAGRIRFRSSAT